MAEKNYKTVAVVPEAPRTIDDQQLYVYVPQGTTSTFGVFKPDGQQFVITSDGILRVDASKLIQLANPPATVTEDGGDVGVDIEFTEADSTLLRQFQFQFKNIVGPQGEQGETGIDALICSYVENSDYIPSSGMSGSIAPSYFNRTPKIGEYFVYYLYSSATGYYYYVYATVQFMSDTVVTAKIVFITKLTGTTGDAGSNALTYNDTYVEEYEGDISDEPISLPVGSFSRQPVADDTFLLVYTVTESNNVYIAIMKVLTVGDTSVSCNIVPGTQCLIKGPQGDKGDKGETGVSITSVTQVGVQGGTLVTITMSDGQSTSFTVYNGIDAHFVIVDQLPTTDIDLTAIYLVPCGTPGTNDTYDEYIYVNNKWEKIGCTDIDLSNYVTTNTDQPITGIKTFTQYIKTPQVANPNGNALVRYKDAENKSVFGSSQSGALIMGSGTHPKYSQSGDDFEGDDIALMNDVIGTVYDETSYTSLATLVDAVYTVEPRQLCVPYSSVHTILPDLPNYLSYGYVVLRAYSQPVTIGSGATVIDSMGMIEVYPVSYATASKAQRPWGYITQGNNGTQETWWFSGWTNWQEELVSGTNIKTVNGQSLLGSGDVVIESGSDIAISTTYSNLVTLRDDALLVVGARYRITDYVCTTTQANSSAASHQFDIIVTADAENVLNENATVVKHDGDTYFDNCNLDAWQIKYCLDNDTTRFVWADGTNGKGVIYYMKDEWDNECPYDFKNIQFKRYKITACTNVPGLVDFYAVENLKEVTTSSSDAIWAYTFNYYYVDKNENYDLSIWGNDGQLTDGNLGYTPGVYDNKIARAHSENVLSAGIPVATSFALNNIVCLSLSTNQEDSGFKGLYNNVFGENCSEITIGDKNNNNVFGANCRWNTLGNECYNNKFGDKCEYMLFTNAWYNVVGSQTSLLQLSGARYNNFGRGCQEIVLGNGANGNTFGQAASNITFGDTCLTNVVGPYCSNIELTASSENTFDVSCQSITLTGASRNKFGKYVGYFEALASDFANNTIENNVEYVTFAKSASVYNVTVKSNVKGASINNKLELYDADIASGAYPVTISKSSNGYYCMMWNTNGSITAGKYKTTATATSWTTMTSDMLEASQSYVDSKIDSAITTALNTAV